MLIHFRLILIFVSTFISTGKVYSEKSDWICVMTPKIVELFLHLDGNIYSGFFCLFLVCLFCCLVQG